MNTVVGPSMPCHRCGGELYLTAAVPHPTMPGHRTLPLCPRCDAQDPAAQDLLAWFAIHGTVDVDTLAELEDLVDRWAAVKATGSGVSPQQVERDLSAWRRGEFD